MKKFFKVFIFGLSIIPAIIILLDSKTINNSYKFHFLRKMILGIKMLRNYFFIKTGTSFKTHLSMALKILEIPPAVQGDVIECGTWKGGSAANLSLVCKIVGRKLIIYDSFEGLPALDPADRESKFYKQGDYFGSIDEVKKNITRFGEIGCCEFRKGWFKDTLPMLDTPIVLAFLDVDLEASLDICVRSIWPYLTEKGHIFIDEVVGLNYCALFYSERFWDKYFQRVPPGLIGAGTGLPLGEFYLGPWTEIHNYPMQHACAGAYTRKDFSGYWNYYPNQIL